MPPSRTKPKELGPEEAGTIVESCPCCQAVLTGPQGLNKHLQRTCWRNFQNPLWIEALKGTYARESAESRVRTVRANMLKRARAEQTFLVEKGLPGTAAMEVARTPHLQEVIEKKFAGAKRKEAPGEEARVDGDEEEMQPPDVEAEEETAVGITADDNRPELQLSTCHFCKRLLSTRVLYRFHLLTREDKHFKTSVWMKEAISTYAPGHALINLPREMEKITWRHKEKQAAATTSATEAEVNTNAFLQPTIPSPPSKPDAWMTLQDCFLSQSAIAWHAWFLMSGTARRLRSTRRLAESPFSGLHKLVEDALNTAKEAGCLPGDDLKAMLDIWRKDACFKAAFRRMSAVHKAQATTGPPDALKTYVQEEIQAFGPFLLEWAAALQRSWSRFATLLTAHAEQQPWKNATEAREIVVQNEKHWAYWQPFFLDLPLALQSEREHLTRAKGMEAAYGKPPGRKNAKKPKVTGSPVDSVSVPVPMPAL